MAAAAAASEIVPAQVGFLAIYNPSLGTTDETVADQIVYYASASSAQSSTRRRRQHHDKNHRAARDSKDASSEERNERLRQIGLAQGMVEFGRSFSNGQPVDAVDTERSRVVLHELEPGWWILASIDLTRLPLPPSKSTTPPPPPPPPPSATGPSSPATGSPEQPPRYDYSAREVKPALLLQQDLLRAHALFLLHHSPPPPSSSSASSSSLSPPSLATLFATTPREVCTAFLARYWDAFLASWDVLLHGNPACAVLGGVKIAACGELGIGVGEEERGSGERAVLEGLVGRVDGLVDLVVGRFGEVDGETVAQGKGRAAGSGGGSAGGVSDGGQWLGLGNDVGAEDGAVFLGVGALSRQSLRTATAWMEDIYAWGESAYGVADSSAAAGSRLRKQRAAGKKGGLARASPAEGGQAKQGRRASTAAATSHARQSSPVPAKDVTNDTGGMDKMFSYLKLGYGTYWSLGNSTPATSSDADDEPAQPTDVAEGVDSPRQPPQELNKGYFLLGLGEQSKIPEQSGQPTQEDATRFRTVTVELDNQEDQTAHGHQDRRAAQLRPAIYVHRPFIYTLLFHDSPVTSWDELSQSLHTQLSTLHKPLLTSTAYRPEKPPATTTSSSQPQAEHLSLSLYDLVFDPATLTIHSTIPNIPDPLADVGAAAAASWTRIEALGTHAQILSMYAATRGDRSARERTCKTARGWWVVWNRIIEAGAAGAIPGADGVGIAEDDDNGAEVGGSGRGGGEKSSPAGKEVFLVRRASDHGGGAGGLRGVSASYVSGVGGGGGAGGWADGASRLAQGIGVDTRRYIEGLLSLNR